MNSAVRHTSANAASDPLVSVHLESKRAKLQAEIAETNGRIAETNERIAELFPPAEQLVQALQARFVALCNTARTDLYNQAYSASSAPARLLAPMRSQKNPTGQRNAWIVVAAAASGGVALAAMMNFSGALTLVLAAICAGFMYRRLYRRARRLYAVAVTEKSHANLDTIKGYALSLLRFDLDPSDDPKYIYNCTQVFSGQPNNLTNTWWINARYGEQFGATYVAFRNDASSTEQNLFLRLPVDGFKAVFIELHDGSLPLFDEVQKDLIALVSGEFSRLSMSIAPLADAISIRRLLLKKINTLNAKLESLDAQKKAWRNVAIDQKALDEIIMQVELFKAGMANAPKGLLLWGLPGTGKTSIARTMASSTGCAFIAVTSADLKGEYQGHTAPKVKAVWKKAREQAPCIMFVDECDGVFGMRGDVGSTGVNFNSELVEAFLAEWDGMNSVAGQVFVVGATNLREHLDNAIVSRFSAMVEIGLPDMEARRRILQIELAKSGISMQVTDAMAKDTAGMSGRDLNTLAVRFHGVTLTQEPTDALFRQVVKDVRGKSATAVEDVSWDEVVLPERLKTKLQSLGKKIKRAEEYRKTGLPVPKSLLLYGPPGTGKTQIARALATESGLAFQAVSTADIKGSYLGESGKRVKALFEKARAQAPCLLFIDEIDIVTGARGGKIDSYSSEIVGQLLQEMDGISSRASTGQVFVIGATNCREDMDPAVLSRFEDQEEVALPDIDARTQILRVLLGNKPIGFDLEITLPHLAAATDGYSGRDLASLVNAAASQAMQRADLQGLEIEDIRILESDFSPLERHTSGTDAVKAVP